MNKKILGFEVIETDALPDGVAIAVDRVPDPLHAVVIHAATESAPDTVDGPRYPDTRCPWTEQPCDPRCDVRHNCQSARDEHDKDTSERA